MPDGADVLARIDDYIDRLCRRTAELHEVGPFDLFVEPPPFWPKYARPRPGTTATTDDLGALGAYQMLSGVEREIEYLHDLHPALAAVAQAAGWDVALHPLLVLGEGLDHPVADEGVMVRFLGPDDPDLARIHAIGAVGFAAAGMMVGPEGIVERDTKALESDPASLIARLEREDQVTVAAYVDGEPVASGSHQPDEVTRCTEIVGVVTLPAFRRRGLGALVTATLAEDARRRGLETIWLSAADADVAEMYARLGFERAATFAHATLAGSYARELK